MPPAGPAPPRLSRETRLLLITALVSLVALWALARVRFPDRPVSSNPLPPVLTQLAPRSPIEEVPALVADLTPRIALSVVPVVVEDPRHGVGGRHPRAGLRIRDDVVAVLVEDGARPAGAVTLVARDPASGLTLLRLRQPPQLAVVEPLVWSPRRPDLPRYLLAADTADDVVSLRPVFVGSLLPAPSAVWSEAIWLLPARTDISSGDVVFTSDGAFAGLAVRRDDRTALVPGPQVLALAHRLLDGPGTFGWLGVHVQALTDDVAFVTGAAHGVVVTHVAADGPAASRLQVADIIESVDDVAIDSIDRWRARAGRLAPGASVDLHVRRAGAVETIEVTAAGAEEAADALPHGLSMRSVAGLGVEVLRVEPGSSGALAGLEPGDLMTVVNGVRAPTVAQFSRAFAAPPGDRPLLVAITRGEMYHVLTMPRRR